MKRIKKMSKHGEIRVFVYTSPCNRPSYPIMLVKLIIENSKDKHSSIEYNGRSHSLSLKEAVKTCYREFKEYENAKHNV